MRIDQDQWDAARVTIFDVLNNWKEQDPNIQAQMKTLVATMDYDLSRLSREPKE